MTRLRERLWYWFDSIISKGTGAMVTLLALASCIIIVFAGAAVALTGVHPADSEPIGFVEGSWQALMRTLDAGTMGGDTGWGFRIIMFITTIGGVLIISTLIGVLTNGVQAKTEDLRRGKSRVIEHGHTVILGWTEQIFSIIPELIEANSNQKQACIVILGNQDKVMMEGQIRQRSGNTRQTRIVCRTGDPLEISDLEVVNLNESKSIIILPPENGEQDCETIKTALAILNSPKRRPAPYHIVAELRDARTLQAARVVGGNEVEWVVTSDFVARIIAQTCRQSGLSVIYSDLLDFEGDEIYLFQAPALIGCTYQQTLLAFEKNSVLGICRGNTECCLNPPMQQVLDADDKLIVIAQDDDQIHLDSNSLHRQIETSNFSDTQKEIETAEKLLILGWNALGPLIINELAYYIPAGSTVRVISANLPAYNVKKASDGHSTWPLVEFQQADTTDRHMLDALDLGQYQHIVVLCYDDSDYQKADARTLMTLLHLRDIANQNGFHYSIVSQMLDVRNRNLAATTKADDFIVSDRLISLMMAQISENKALHAVFTDLFDAAGSEIYLKPASNYVSLDKNIDFYVVVEAAARKGETAIGYRLTAQAADVSHTYGIHLNPCKSEPIVFTQSDKVIVLAES